MTVPLPVFEFIRAGAPHQGESAAVPAPVQGGKSIRGLYLHVPFCFHRCHYCDFYSVVERPEQADAAQADFTAALAREIADRAARLSPRPDTVFVGGGTPTLLTPPHWRTLLGALQAGRLLAGVDEFTVEANPETVTAELADVLAEGGVTRASIGAQSFNPRHLKTLERWHEPANVSRSVNRFRDAGIERLNLDLIFAIPGQTLDDFAADLDAAIGLGVEHLSCYALTFEPNTAMTTRLGQGRITRTPEDLEAAMYELAMDRLADAGFEHYEISAWARPGTQSRHNLHYWRDDDYLGLGPGAASHVAGMRWKNKPHLGQYVAASPGHPVVDVESLDERGRAGEALMMGLRLREGVDTAWLETAFADRSDDLSMLHESGLLERAGQRTRLTRRGLLVADSVLARLIH